jgi:Bacteriodetes cell division protein (FtsL-like)
MEEGKARTPEEPQKEDVRPVKKLHRLRAFFHNIIIGEVFSRDSFFKTIPYLGYLTIIAIVYISNTYYAEKTFRQIEKTKLELKELRFQYISSKSELMFYSKQTEIAKRVIYTGLKETTIPPFKIFYDKDSLNVKNQEVN